MTTTEEVKSYAFTFTFSASGIVNSNLALEQARDQFNRELGAIYNTDAVEVTEFREATSEEVKEYEAAITAVIGNDVEPSTLN